MLTMMSVVSVEASDAVADFALTADSMWLFRVVRFYLIRG